MLEYACNMGEFVYDITRIVPSKEAIDLSLLPESLSTPEGFKKAVEELTKDELPHFFPKVPDFIKASKEGAVTNQEYRETQLTLPGKLYNSGTYEGTILRGPMEEIIIANEKERIKMGLPGNIIKGHEWSENFRTRFNSLYKIGPKELNALHKQSQREEMKKYSSDKLKGVGKF